MLFNQKGNPSNYLVKIIDLGIATDIEEAKEICNEATNSLEYQEFNFFARDWASAETIITKCYRKFNPKENFAVKTLREKIEMLAKESDPKICEYKKENHSDVEK